MKEKLIAGSIIIAAIIIGASISAAPQTGRYQIHYSNGIAWRMDTHTGRASFCAVSGFDCIRPTDVDWGE